LFSSIIFDSSGERSALEPAEKLPFYYSYQYSDAMSNSRGIDGPQGVNLGDRNQFSVGQDRTEGGVNVTTAARPTLSGNAGILQT